MKRRGSGILLHITSLPSPYAVGDLGPWAYKFADFLAESKQSFWQILPLNPTDVMYGSSPYHTISAFASSPLLISPELMARDGFLEKAEIKPVSDRSKGQVDYDAAVAHKGKLFHLAYERFKERGEDYGFEEFCRDNSHWLDDFALFVALKAHFRGQAWCEWPPEVRDRGPQAIKSSRQKLHDAIEMEKFLQYVFARQWSQLKGYCNGKGIQIIGDTPIYVDYDSVDVWTNCELFKLDSGRKPYVVAGVPPDYFSSTGQLWGNPIYRWDVLKETGFRWWVQRMARSLSLFDLVRIDHFRGLVGYWEVPSTETTAINGKWVEAPARDLFKQLTETFPYLPVIAEDLGVITPDVTEVLQQFELPGMKVLLFAFGDDLAANPYIPHNVGRNCVIYTGTHDNNTVKGWFQSEATPETKKRLFHYLGREVPPDELHWELVRLAMMSVANMAIFPMQDILGLGEEARMNRPATANGNWRWRLIPEQVTDSLREKLGAMTKIYGRA